MAKAAYWYEYWAKKKSAKNDFKKEFFKLINNLFSKKAIENVRKQTVMKLVKKERRNYLVLEPNYYIKKFFTENFLTIEMRNVQILMNKPLT